MLVFPFLASGWFSLGFPLNHGHFSVACFPSHLSQVVVVAPFFSELPPLSDFVSATDATLDTVVGDGECAKWVSCFCFDRFTAEDDGSLWKFDVESRDAGRVVGMSNLLPPGGIVEYFEEENWWILE
jgi:hypothetical protein